MVSIDTACNIFRFRDRFINASNIAPRAPTLAASVGVATPPSMEPRTATMRITGGSKPLIRATNRADCAGESC